MKLDHVAIYTSDLEGLRQFYETYFGGESNSQYHNPVTGLRTYFLSFEGGSRLELMSLPELAEGPGCRPAKGLTHLSFKVTDREAVDALTHRITGDGYILLSAPRITGDGYYESVVADPDGNRVEIVA